MRPWIITSLVDVGGDETRKQESMPVSQACNPRLVKTDIGQTVRPINHLCAGIGSIHDE